MQIESTELPLRLAEQQSGTANYNSVSLTVALGMVRFFQATSFPPQALRGDLLMKATPVSHRARSSGRPQGPLAKTGARRCHAESAPCALWRRSNPGQQFLARRRVIPRFLLLR